MDSTLKKPAVSVLMPAYNAERYIKLSIESVLNQTLKDLELIIVNDGSTDNTETVIRSFNDPRIRYTKNEKNSGLGAVRNQLISLVSAEYMAWLDADDIALPKRFEFQKRFLDTHPDFALVGTWVELIDEHGHKTGVNWRTRTKPEDMRAALFFGNQFSQSAIMNRTKDLPSPIYRSEYAPAEEYDLFRRLADSHKLGTVAKTLVQYRVLDKSASHGSNKQEIAREKIALDNLSKLGITPTADELVIHRNNFEYSGGDAVFLKKREEWLLRLIRTNQEKNVYDDVSFKKITGERWLLSCRTNSIGFSTWKQCWRSPLARFISKKEHWRDILLFGLKAVFS